MGGSTIYHNVTSILAFVYLLATSMLVTVTLVSVKHKQPPSLIQNICRK